MSTVNPDPTPDVLALFFQQQDARTKCYLAILAEQTMLKIGVIGSDPIANNSKNFRFFPASLP